MLGTEIFAIIQLVGAPAWNELLVISLACFSLAIPLHAGILYPAIERLTPTRNHEVAKHVFTGTYVLSLLVFVLGLGMWIGALSRISGVLFAVSALAALAIHFYFFPSNPRTTQPQNVVNAAVVGLKSGPGGEKAPASHISPSSLVDV
jgi:hypothetical protein